MAKYLLLKHYRGGPEKMPNHAVPMAQWAPQEVTDHYAYMDDVIKALTESGEYVDSQALSPRGTFVRFDAQGKPPVTDGPFAETKDLVAGWIVIDVDSEERAMEVASLFSSAPGPGGRPLQEWIEVRPFLTPDATMTDTLIEAGLLPA